MHTTNAYAYNSVTQENNNKHQTVNKKQQSINNWSWHIPEITTTYYNWGWNRMKMFSWEKKKSMDRRCSAVDRRWHERGENKCNGKKIRLLVAGCLRVVRPARHTNSNNARSDSAVKVVLFWVVSVCGCVSLFVCPRGNSWTVWDHHGILLDQEIVKSSYEFDNLWLCSYLKVIVYLFSCMPRKLCHRHTVLYIH